MSDPQHYDLIIIGGGAAGLATAIFAARAAPGRRIAILDGARKLGAKILISGGGRCNVTNVRIRPEDFCGGSRNTIRCVLQAFTGPATVEFFREIGISLYEEQWGKLFPESNSAKTVLNALLREAQRLNVELRTGCRIVEVFAQGNGFRLIAEVQPAEACENVAVFDSATVVLATGGQSFPKTGSDGYGFELARRLGHTIVPTTPALAPLTLHGDFHSPLSGIAQEVALSLTIEDERPVRISGPMLWTHFGVSGPAAMDASRHWHRAVLSGGFPKVLVNFLPGSDFAAVDHQIMALTQRQPRILARNALATLSAPPIGIGAAELRVRRPHGGINGRTGQDNDALTDDATTGVESLSKRRGDAGSGWTWQKGEQTGLSKRLIEALLVWAGVPLATVVGQLTRDQRRQIVHALTEWPMPVANSRGYDYAEATAGGVALNEINPATMESRICPGLFLVGEVLDVDGRIGGFNFQWAWSTGFVAGAASARRIVRPGSTA